MNETEKKQKKKKTLFSLLIQRKQFNKHKKQRKTYWNGKRETD